jgi:hypothetical protein
MIPILSLICTNVQARWSCQQEAGRFSLQIRANAQLTQPGEPDIPGNSIQGGENGFGQNGPGQKGFAQRRLRAPATFIQP